MRKYIFEADDDNTTGGGENNAADNNAAADNNQNDTAENNDTNNNDNQEDNNQDDQNQEDDQQNDDENQDDNNDEDNQDEDDDFGINDDDEDGGDDNQDDGGDSDSSEEESNLDPNSLKAKDRELFDSLSIPEQQIKVRELKSQFAELYSNCISIIDRINDIGLELNDEYPQLKRLSEVLYKLKDTISFYILNIYDIKSYFENDIIFNRYLTILNGVKKVLETVKNGVNNDK